MKRKEGIVTAPQSTIENKNRAGFSSGNYATKNFAKQEDYQISDAVLALAIDSVINKHAKAANSCKYCGKVERLSKREQLCLRCEQKAEHVFRTFPLVVQRARQLQIGGAK